jgi:hypothetical protein
MKDAQAKKVAGFIRNSFTEGKPMDDLDKYIEARKEKRPNFEKNFEKGYENFKIGVLLKQARLEAGLTQDNVKH